MFFTENMLAWRWLLVFAGLLPPNPGEQKFLAEGKQAFVAVQVSGVNTDFQEQVRVKPVWPRWRTSWESARCAGSRRYDVLFVQWSRHELFGPEWHAVVIWPGKSEPEETW